MLARAHLPKVLSSPVVIVEPLTPNPSTLEAYLGTISLNSSNFIRPAGVSPIWISIKTIGRVVEGDEEAMVVVVEHDVRRARRPIGTTVFVGILTKLGQTASKPLKRPTSAKGAVNEISFTKAHDCGAGIEI